MQDLMQDGALQASVHGLELDLLPGPDGRRRGAMGGGGVGGAGADATTRRIGFRNLTFKGGVA